MVEAFSEMLESNFRGAMRNMMEATNTQASEDELRERVDTQAEFHPQQAAVARFRGWVDDDPRAEARAIGERLWIFTAPDIAGPWLPPSDVLQRLTAENLPDARVVQIESESGPVSHPEEAAAMVRRVSASVGDAQRPT